MRFLAVLRLRMKALRLRMKAHACRVDAYLAEYRGEFEIAEDYSMQALMEDLKADWHKRGLL